MRITRVVCLIFLCYPVSGQTIVRQYNDRNGELSDAATAYTFTIGKKNKQGFFYDSVKTFFARSGKIKSLEVHDPYGAPMGNYQTFYENGRRKAAGRYERKNFKLYVSSADSVDQIILEFNDSTGHTQVHNGKGWINGPIDIFRETGRIDRGLRDSLWTAYDDNGKIKYQESWHQGELVDGISYDEQGKEVYYKFLSVGAEPVGGYSLYYERISAIINYPKEAEKRGIEGKVIIAFYVSKDGVVRSPRVVKGLGYGCEEEAIRMLMDSPNWKPALKRGLPVNSKATITYIFKLT